MPQSAAQIRDIYIKLAKGLDLKPPFARHLTVAEATQLVRDYEERSCEVLRNGHWAAFKEKK